MPGVLFPLTEKGDRSTTGFSKNVFKAVAESLGCQDLSEAIGKEKDWRQKYDGHLENVVEDLAVMSLIDTAKMSQAMLAGLEKARAMEFEVKEGETVPLATAMASPERKFDAVTVKGTGAAKTEVTVPYHGEQLVGQALDAQCDLWAKVGTIEPGAAAAIKSGAKKLGELKGRTFLVLGASSELGPVRPLLEAGATVVAVMRSSEKRWAELIAFARGSAGTLLAPVPASKATGSDEELAKAAGADLLSDAPGISEWLLRCGSEASGPVTLCTYLYADGEANVRLTAAADFIAEAAAKKLGKEKLSFAYLVSGSTSHLIAEEAVRAQEEIFASGSNFWSKAVGQRVNCAASPQGAKLWAAHKSGEPATYHFFRGLANLQGPNYAVAQYMRQWRAVLLHMEGFAVSTPLTPNCRTKSVVHNATMRVLLEGMSYWKPMESFDADTARMVMLAILITDIVEPVAKPPSPMQIFGLKAFHSGLWRCPFQLASLGVSTWILGKVAPRPKPVGFE